MPASSRTTSVPHTSTRSLTPLPTESGEMRSGIEPKAVWTQASRATAQTMARSARLPERRKRPKANRATSDPMMAREVSRMARRTGSVWPIRELSVTTAATRTATLSATASQLRTTVAVMPESVEEPRPGPLREINAPWLDSRLPP